VARLPGRVHADNLGSFLRPSYLRSALDRRASPDELRPLQDRAVREVVALQEEVGLPFVTDGEFRRRIWYSTVLAVASGFDPERFDRVYVDASGRESHHGGPVVVAPLRRVAGQVDVELGFLRGLTDRPIKVTMPSPTHFLSYWMDGVSDRAYPSREAFLEDLIGVMQADAQALAEAGAAYLQLDAPKYTYFSDRRLYPDPSALGETLARHVRNDRRVFERLTGVVTGLHVCRGNYRGMFGSSTPYSEFAEVLFREAAGYDRLLLEYDDARAGGFSPLRFVPPGVTVVLGLVTTKRPELEREDDLRRQIDAAARFVPRERLALSTQCGFASTYEGNELSLDDQRRKLELVMRTAEREWGAAVAD
jgi:5-methyltetrahydropteroyltriglutamate--homocysteine methyltransferase